MLAMRLSNKLIIITINLRMDRNDRIEVFLDTVKCVNRSYYKKDADGDITEFEQFPNEFDTFYDKDITDQLAFENLEEYDTVIEVINKDCLYAARDMIDEGLNPLVINNASFSRPGGGVEKGSAAQEENLCRRTNLFKSLYQFREDLAMQYGIKPRDEQYPLPMRFGAIYSPGIVVLKASEDKNYEYLDKPFVVDILTIAALKKPMLTKDGTLNDADKDIVRDKIRTMLNLALDWENDSVVFGAFGCGAYKNPPEEIAKLFKEVINEPNYKNKLKKIVFAILDDGNAHREHNPRGNFLPFKEIFENADK